MSRFCYTITIVTLVLASAPVSAPTQEKPPVFAAGVELAAIDVTVVDAIGRPVRDLTAADFTLTVDGKPRRVVTAEFVAQDGGEETSAVPPPPAHLSTNEGLVPGRLVLITVDQGNIEMGGGREVIRAAGRLLDRLRPADRVGLLTLPGPDPHEEFTADKERVRAALQRVVGRGRLRSRRLSLSEALAYVERDDPERWQRATERECPGGSVVCVHDLRSEALSLASDHRLQSERSLGTLTAAFEALARIEARKVMVLVSQGLGLPDSGSQPRLTPRLRELAEAAARARIAFYVVRVPRGAGVGADSDTSHDVADDSFLHDQGLESLASRAKGTVFRGAPERAFDRLAREISGYYLLGFEPADRDRDGKSRNVRVSVSRPGLTVRARASVVIAKPAGPKEEERALLASLQSPIAATTIPLRVATYAMGKDKADKVTVLVSGEIGREPAPGLVVACVLVDGRGRVAASSVQRASAEAQGVSGPMPFSALLSVPPQRYTLKIAVRDRLGRQGSVEHPVKAALTTFGDLEYSDLMLGLQPAAGTGVRPGLGLELSAGTLVARLDLYNKSRPAADVRMEVARDSPGPSVREIPARLVDTPNPGRRIAQAVIPVDGLPPGDYVVRATVSLAGTPVGVATHPFRVTGR